MEILEEKKSIPSSTESEANKSGKYFIENNKNSYEKFYSLTDRPFNLTPDAVYFYPNPNHLDSMARTYYAVKEGRGFVVLVGEVGSGKTMLIRTLLKEFDDNVKSALILNSYLNPVELLLTILDDLNVNFKIEGEVTKHKLLAILNNYLLEEHHKCNKVVVIIDEAQNLTMKAFEELRMLSNLETDRDKLLQIVLVGQPELENILNTPQMRQLRQRITVKIKLQSLNYFHTQKYIFHRLKIAGANKSIGFTQEALNKIYTFTEGIPRLINNMCENILVTGFVNKTKIINAELVNSALNAF